MDLYIYIYVYNKIGMTEMDFRVVLYGSILDKFAR